jgi:hypothetical protein
MRAVPALEYRPQHRQQLDLHQEGRQSIDNRAELHQSRDESVESVNRTASGVRQILEEIKHEESEASVAAAGEDPGGAEDDLGFLHGMNLNHLVMEFEAATNGSGVVSDAELGGILSLTADDDEAADDEAFPELADVGTTTQPTTSSNEDGRKNDEKVEGEGVKTKEELGVDAAEAEATVANVNVVVTASILTATSSSKMN